MEKQPKGGVIVSGCMAVAKNWSQPDVSTRPDFRLFPLFCALFFPCSPLFPASAAFLSPLQGLAL
jgi:hypothetical protein